MANRTLTILLLGLHILASVVAADAAEPEIAHWIWSTNNGATKTVLLRRDFRVAPALQRAELRGIADYSAATVYLNGKLIQESKTHDAPWKLDLTELLASVSDDQRHSLVVACRPAEGPSALMMELDMRFADSSSERLVTGSDWRFADISPGSFQWSKLEAYDWEPVQNQGPVSDVLLKTMAQDITINPLDDYTQWKRALNVEAGTNPGTFDVRPGFEVSLLRSAQEGEDSWVCLAQDPVGRWIVAREKKGLLRLTVDDNRQDVVQVEVINENLAECRGLLFAHNSLYAMANNDKALYRLRDTTGDDRFDEVTRLSTLPGDVGHGRNQLTLGPDGLIYGIFGDAVFEPQDASTLVPSLSRPTDEETTRSGFVARTDAKGQQWEVLVRGLRNPFGIDFNEHGDMFTYDADAEFDMGSSWYRPTRVNHLLPGGDYGWRRVTGRWPPYFPDRPDTPQPTLHIGKGSPTAVEFGAGDQFPWQYRNALFVLDWAYGRILAVHFEPRGASYLAVVENFLRGRPLNVTDVEFGKDGAMYFVTGGRGTQSALYRVSYAVADRSPPTLTPQQERRQSEASDSRDTLRSLQSKFGSVDESALRDAWTYLGHDDPWIRHAARTLLEWQPVDNWKELALTETRTDAALAALTALLRMGRAEDVDAIGQRLASFKPSVMQLRQTEEYLFLCQKCLSASSESANSWRENLVQAVDDLYPHRSTQINMTLGLILSNEDSVSGFTPRTMALLQSAKSQEESLHYLFVLRNQGDGWTPELRTQYFDALKTAQSFVSGEGMPTFQRRIREESLATVPADDRSKFETQLASSDLQEWAKQYGTESRAFVRKWALDDFEDWSNWQEGRDLKRGAFMFGAAQCIACHRFGPQGGVQGPDLTSVAGRFAPRDLLTSILEPSRIIAEKYQSEAFELQDGQLVTGRIVSGDYRSDRLQVMPNLLEPDKLVEFSKSEVVHRQAADLSAMPTGLVDTLDRDEILDLLAYLLRVEDDSDVADE